MTPEPDALARCGWADGPRASAAMRAYHDLEWGVPSRDEIHLFEMLTLESAQAGLSWSTVLAKRDGYREAFANFEPEAVATFGEDRVEELVRTGPIIRNRAKIASTVSNARVIAALHEHGETLADLLWAATGGAPRHNAWTQLEEIPATTPEADGLAKRLRALGLRFVGPTVCYSLMQSVGIVNDHLVSCHRWAQLARGPEAGAPS